MLPIKIVELDEVDSTNTFARRHFDDYPDGTLITARSQSAGRGRRGRAWITPPGVCFCGTMIFKCLSDGFHAGCIVGLGALAALREIAPEVKAFLKWPNDIYVGDRKLAGILSEGAKIEQGRLTGVVSGVGVNVNLPESVISTLDQPATSLLMECGRKFPLNFFSKKVAESLIRYYITYSKCAESVFSEWKAANLLIGERLTITDDSGRARRGIFRDILSDGAMVFEEDGVGMMTEFRCGDVKIDRSAVDWERVDQKRLALSASQHNQRK